jgi:serine/threonine protein phosphatase PrpC
MALLYNTLTNTGTRRSNEDALFAGTGQTTDAAPVTCGLFIVADGMGGHQDGQVASQLACRELADFVAGGLHGRSVALLSDEVCCGILREGVRRANQEVYRRKIAERSDMGTTITAALVIGAMAYIANVGDSRAYLYRPATGLLKLTQDHSVVASMVAVGLLVPDDVYTHPAKNQIYRCLGEQWEVEVDIFRQPLLPGDLLLLCSDGLWEMVREPEIEAVLKGENSENPHDLCGALVQRALSGGGKDNVSVVVVHLPGTTPLPGGEHSWKPRPDDDRIPAG